MPVPRRVLIIQIGLRPPSRCPLRPIVSRIRMRSGTIWIRGRTVGVLVLRVRLLRVRSRLMLRRTIRMGILRSQNPGPCRAAHRHQADHPELDPVLLHFSYFPLSLHLLLRF